MSLYNIKKSFLKKNPFQQYLVLKRCYLSSQPIARAITFNKYDINQIEGVYPAKPTFRKLAVIDNNNENENEFAIAGNEGVAEVIAVGDQLNNDFKVGDWVVMGKPGFGTWCTHAIANGNEVTRIPNDGIGLIQAATLTVNPCSAYRMLKDFVVDLKENDFVIQNGANSGVGQSIIQIANARGIKTINIVRNRPDIDELKSHLGSLGATYTATDEELSHFKFKNTIKDLLSEHKTSNGIRLGLNCVGGKATTDMIKHLRWHVVTYGAMSRQPITIPASLLIFKNIKFHGFWMAKWNELHPKEERLKMLEEIVSLMKDGKFTDMRNEVTVWGDENDNDETLKKKFFAVYDKAGAAFKAADDDGNDNNVAYPPGPSNYISGITSSTTKLATSPSHLPLQLHSSQERLKQSPQLRTMLNTSPDTESHNSSELIQIYNSEVAPIVSISSDDGGGERSQLPINNNNGNNSSKSQDLPEFCIEKLSQKNISSKPLMEYLLSLRTVLSSANFSWIKEFINKNGLKILESLLEKYAVGRCEVLKSPSLILRTVFCLLLTPNNKLCTQIAEILSVLCVWSLNGHILVVDAFSDSRVINQEKYLFQYFMGTFKTKNDVDGKEEDGTSIEYRVTRLNLTNVIVNKSEQIEERILLQEGFVRKEIYNYFRIIKKSDPPDSLINQINVYKEEHKKDFAELNNIAHEIIRDAKIEVLAIIEQFIEKIKTTNSIKEQWQSVMNNYNSSIQHIIGKKYSLVSGIITDQEIDSLKKSINNLSLKQFKARSPPPPLPTTQLPISPKLLEKHNQDIKSSITKPKPLLPSTAKKIDTNSILTINSSSTPCLSYSKLQNSTTKINKQSPPIPLPKRKLTNNNNPSKFSSKSKGSLKQLFWNKLSVNEINKTVWQEIPSEQILITQYTGDLSVLGNAENYFKNIAMISRLAERLTCMIFRHKFENKVQKLVPTVLVIGNYLNTSSFRGNASGFQLDALLKMKDTKAMDSSNGKGIATLLHYLVYTLEMCQSDIINFMEELPNLEASARISTTSILSSVASLFSGVSQIKNELEILKQMSLLSSTTNSEIKDNFIIVMSEFIQGAEPIIEKIKNMTNELEEESKKIVTYYYGENPDDKKIEDLLGLLLTFSSSFMKAKKENEEFTKKKIHKGKNSQSKQQILKENDIDITIVE
ncbi:10556_t:CDS:10 [Entrophospora sp. SA101]|nr:10556_t:CDS:10 [Entrophospora sp. SA101]